MIDDNGLLINNKQFYDDIELLMYPRNSKSYVVCARNLLFNKKKRNGKFELVQESPLNVLYRAGYKKDFISQDFFSIGNFERIVGIKDSHLLITCIKGEEIFEVECMSIIDDCGYKPQGIINYYSHSLNREEMYSLLMDAFFHRDTDKVYIHKIERFLTESELDYKASRRCRENKADGYVYEEHIYDIIPNWAYNEKAKDLICIIHSFGKSITVEVSCEDFDTYYNTDRDGGWFVYTHKETVLGYKFFATKYELENYFEKIKLMDNCSCVIDEKKAEYDYLKMVIHFNFSVTILFQEIGVAHSITKCTTYEEGAYQSEEGWYYGSGLKGLCKTKDELNRNKTNS